MIPKSFDEIYHIVGKIEFTDYYNQDYFIRIRSIFPLFDTPVLTLKATGNPVEIIYGSSGSETEKQIISTQAIVNAYNIEDFQLLSLLVRRNRDCKMELLKIDTDIIAGNIITKETLMWDGFMIPDQWSEPLNTTPYLSTISFIDGITLLKNADFADDDGCYFRGKFRIKDIIGFIVNKIRINRRVIDEVNMFDEQTTTLSSWGNEKWIDVEYFRNMNCYDVLTEILKPYGARISYAVGDNAYRIERCNDAVEQRRSSRYVYDSSSNSYNLSSTNIRETNLSINNASEPIATRITWMESTQELFRLPGWRYFHLTQNYGVKQSIFPRSGFEECDFFQNPNRTRWNLKSWLHNGINKAFVDGETVVEFLPATTGRFNENEIYPYSPPAYIQGTTEDEYSLENATTEQTEDIFALEITMRNKNLVPSLDIRYYGPRTAPGTTTEAGSLLRTKAAMPEIINSIDINAVNYDTTNWFNMTFEEAVRLFGEIIQEVINNGIEWYVESDDKIYAIFRDTTKIPIGYNAGIVYTVTQFIYNIPLNWFRFKLTKTGPLGQLAISNDDVSTDLTFPVSMLFSSADIKWHFSGNSNNIFSGEMGWRTNGYLKLEIDNRELINRKFFTSGVIAEERPTNEGLVFLRIEKPKDTLLRTRGRDGSFFLESIRMYIIDTPEQKQEKINLSGQNNLTGEVSIMFAETPIKNNFKNNKLKYFGNFYSYSLNHAPGLQYIYGNETVKFSLYDYVVNFYRSLYLNPRNALYGKLDAPGKNLIGKVLTEPHTNKKYVMTYCSYNVVSSSFEGQWHEVTQADAPDFKGDFNNDFNNDFFTGN